EKTINLQIAKALAEELEKMGVHAVLTRTRDAEMGLYARPDVAINKNADFFISIHCNSNTSRNSATGVETYYHMNRRDCRELAKMIQNRICSYTGMTDKGARSDKSLYGIGLAVLRRLNTSSIPGVLIECGYINNSSDAAKLQNPDYQQTLARAVADAIKAYTGSVSE
ncbi:MAG: N-acetylmuramoyl-L-alanine amidase, partial [Abditibacteriota bacterium]|nr:N-acetylmuramoyl-L-alanine amidase [Abditibacteriota bacterium]